MSLEYILSKASGKCPLQWWPSSGKCLMGLMHINELGGRVRFFGDFLVANGGVQPISGHFFGINGWQTHFHQNRGKISTGINSVMCEQGFKWSFSCPPTPSSGKEISGRNAFRRNGRFGKFTPDCDLKMADLTSWSANFPFNDIYLFVLFNTALIYFQFWLLNRKEIPIAQFFIIL